ncbi:MAG: glycosyltransferase [Bryobacteraceae bacterium]
MIPPIPLRSAAGNSNVSRTKVLIVLPAYNEEANIGGLLNRIDEAMADSNLHFQVVVVDDGSRDRTFEVLSEFSERIPLTISRHEVNKGLGVTIRDGLLLAGKLAGKNDIVVTMDADETHTPGMILRMVHLIQEGHDVVIASRYRPGARIFGLSMSRRFVSCAASWLFRIVFPTPGVKDFTCGFRAYRGKVLASAIDKYGEKLVEVEGFQCMVDILLKLRQMDVIFGEVPMILRYDMKLGESKMRMARTMRQTLLLMFKRRFSIQTKDQRGAS